jgi:YVTN family beta-propeller protein
MNPVGDRVVGAHRRRLRWCALLSAAAALVLGVGAPSAGFAVPIVVHYTDGPGEGFNDPILGPQRRAALEFAAAQWERTLEGSVTVVVNAAMDPHGGAGTTALLGSTLAITVHVNFPGAPQTDVYYGAALANQLSARDLNGPEVAEIDTSFNSDVDDPAVLGSVNWYYGTDGEPGSDIDFVTVALHEIGHGLNFFTLIDPTNGTWLNGFPDVYGTYLLRPAVGRFPNLRNADRLAAITSRMVFWTGPALVATAGSGVPVYAPDPFNPGSSLTHWDTSLAGELMAPFYTTPNHDPGLLLPALIDMGWRLAATADTPKATPTPRATPTATPSQQTTPTVTPTRATGRERQLAYVTNFDSSSVTVIDTSSNTVVTTIAVGDGPLGIVGAPDGRTVYVANFRSNAVSVIRTSTNAVARTIPVDGSCNGVAITPDGATLYVSNPSPGTVVAIDTASARVIAVVPVDGQPAGIGVAPHRASVWVARFGAGTVSVIDAEINLVVAEVPLPSISGALNIAFSPGGGFAYVTSIFSRAISVLGVGAAAERESFFPRPRGFPDVIPAGVVIAPDQAHAFVTDANQGGVFSVDTGSEEVVNYIRTGDEPMALAITPDGVFLYVVNSGANTVAVLRTTFSGILARIPVGAAPMGIALVGVPPPCSGDCDGGGAVTIDELIHGVRIALGIEALGGCPSLDTDDNGVVTIAELIAATRNAMVGCLAATTDE